MILEDIKKRARDANKRNSKIGIVFLIFLIVTIIFLIINWRVGIVFAIIGVILLIVWLSISSFHRDSLEEEIFTKCIIPKLENSFKNFKYNSSEINEEIITKLNLIDTGDRIITSRQIDGVYRNTSFVCCGLICQRSYRDDEGDLKYEDTFRGRIFILGISILKSFVMIFLLPFIFQKINP